jgi:diaminopimelate epimerase
MLVTFYKYQGTRNDFILIDDRMATFPKNDTRMVSRMCDRRFGIGADGLILLENDKSAAFGMTYYNSDGKPGSMCGNGGRCIVSFAGFLGIIDSETSFNAVDGLHVAVLDGANVRLKMQPVSEIREKPQALFLDSGSPHHVQMVKGIKDFAVAAEGARLRYGLYGEKGSNINFVEQLGENSFYVRTYERGVEAETLSCGTGVTAVALAMHYSGRTNSETVLLKTPGGELELEFTKNGRGYDDIYLTGPAEQVFKGEWAC